MVSTVVRGANEMCCMLCLREFRSGDFASFLEVMDRCYIPQKPKISALECLKPEELSRKTEDFCVGMSKTRRVAPKTRRFLRWNV